jgi:membrane-associated protease RseP (regulator of RpoE activity)
VTCLVRVPEAYQLVRKHHAVRPGFLLLDADGRKRGSVALVAADPDGSATRAKEYLRRALEAPGPIPDDHQGASDPAAGTGRFEVAEVEAGTLAGEAELRRGDRLLEVNGRPVRTLGDLAGARVGGDSDVYVFEREGRRIEVRGKGKLGVCWLFIREEDP